jgi:hypothetical protein
MYKQVKDKDSLHPQIYQHHQVQSVWHLLQIQMNMRALFTQHFEMEMQRGSKRLQSSNPAVMGSQLPSETA